jgi:histidinol-phosphate aminotransferase
MSGIGPEPSLPLTAGYAARHVRSDLVLLDHNEGPEPSAELLSVLGSVDPEWLRRYRTPVALEAQLAASFGLLPQQVLVTAGGDDAIDRCCRAFLGAGRTLVLAEPTFEMFANYARVARAEIRRAIWPSGPFPLEAVLSEIDAAQGTTAMVPLVTPNNPTGETASATDLRALSQHAPRALIVVDHAYVEYGGEDLTQEALSLPNAVVIRTFSKARGLAGCRVGYVLGSPPAIAALRSVGAPYPVAGLSLLLAAHQWSYGAEALSIAIQRTIQEREELHALLASRGIVSRKSAANFVIFQVGSGVQALAAQTSAAGFSIKTLGGPLHGWVRISMPCNETNFRSLTRALVQSLDCRAQGELV